MVAILEGSPVPRSIYLISASLGGAKMPVLLARTSKSSRFNSSAIEATSLFLLVA